MFKFNLHRYTKVVGRSAALAPDAPYARDTFAYNESDMCSGMGAAALGTAVVGFFGAALMVSGGGERAGGPGLLLSSRRGRSSKL